MIAIIKGLSSQIRRIIKGIALMPQLVVAHFVDHQNKERTFVQQYAWVWFVAIVCWGCLTVYCYKIDFEVLYALKYSSTYNHANSWKEACFNAVLIQFLLLACGGGFFKNLIFRDFVSEFSYPPKTRTTHPLPKIKFSIPHTLQLVVLGALFSYGFYWTLTLSQKTGALARVEAQGNVNGIVKSHQEKSTALQLEHDKKMASYRSDAEEQTAVIVTNCQDRITSINNKYTAIIAQYEARHAQGRITTAHLQKRVNGYQVRKEKAVAPLLKERAEKLEAIQKDLSAKLSEASSHYQDRKRAIDYQASRDRVEVKEQIQETALATQGRNVQFNFLNQLLWVALLIFAHSARKMEPTQTPHKDKQKRRTHTSTHTNAEPVQFETYTNGQERPVKPTTNVHDATQADSWQIFRWPRTGEMPLETREGDYKIQATNRTIKIAYKGKYETLGTVKSWVKKYEKDGSKNHTYKEYCKMVQAMETVKKELDEQEVWQRRVG